MTDLENWKRGVELSHSIIQFGDKHQVEKYRNAPTEGSVWAYKKLLFAGIFSQIVCEELIAFGFQIEPIAISGPVIIPNHVFEVEPELDLAERDAVAASGFKYDRVRIRPSNESLVSEAKAIPIETGKTGRPSNYGKSKEVLDALFKIESNRGKSAAKLHPDFKMEFARRFPRDQWEVDAPSQRSLQEHLKRYRQELAETGNN